MQAPVSETEKSTVYITTQTRAFRIWFNSHGYWQTDVYCDAYTGLTNHTSWSYFSHAPTLVRAMANLGAAI